MLFDCFWLVVVGEKKLRVQRDVVMEVMILQNGVYPIDRISVH